MPICQLDGDWCERHKCNHIGRMRELSQMDDELGAKYRIWWDRKAGLKPQETIPLIKKATNFVRSAVRHVMAGLPKVPPEVKKLRLDFCAVCEHKSSDWTCLQCGCNLHIKTGWAGERCPLNPPKWSEYTQQNPGCGCSS